MAADKPDPELVALRYFGPDGRLNGLPAKRSRRQQLLDLIARRFVPGVHYTEVEVNRELMSLYDDYVTLRRALVDFGFLDRASGTGEYWRSGGTVEL